MLLLKPRSIFCQPLLPPRTIERCTLKTFPEGRHMMISRRERQWSDLLIERIMLFLFGLYSLITLFGQPMHSE